MTFAFDYPLLGIFWTTVFIGFWVGVLYAVFRALGDILFNPELRAVTKALWVAVILLVPFLGIVAYVALKQRAISEQAYQLRS
jgi:drug/metabolite transporter (DMT)-like permease